MVVGQIVFCPRKTGSASISRSWARSSGSPTIHTHDLKYLVVTDIKGSMFLKYVQDNFNKNLSFVNDLDDQHIEYTIIPRGDLDGIFKFFESFKIVTSIRHPLPRRISQFVQDLTLDQVNAVIDSTKTKFGIVVPKIDTKKPIAAADLCKTLRMMGIGNDCVVLMDAHTYLKTSKTLLTLQQVSEIFQKRYITNDTREFSEFFDCMYEFVMPDFNFTDLLSYGHAEQRYTLFGKHVHHELFKLEDLSDPGVFEVFKEFTGVSELSRDHKSGEGVSICIQPSSVIKEFIGNKFKGIPLSKKGSLEYNIAKGFGYY